MSRKNNEQYKYIIFLILVIQMVYFVNYYPKLKTKQSNLDNQIKNMQVIYNQVISKKEQMRLKETNEHLKKLLYPFKTKVPTENEDRCNVIGLSKALNQYPFKQIEVTKIGFHEMIANDLAIIENQYTLSYIGKFETTKLFLENLSSSMQIIKINTVNIKPCSIEGQTDLVETVVNISTFSRKKES